MKIRTLCLIFLSSYSIASFAKEDIAQCVDEQGNVTFTDIHCVTTKIINPNLTIGSVNLSSAKVQNNNQQSDAASASDTRLISITDQAISHCNRKFRAFFKRKHPRVSPVPSIEFTHIVDQFVQGPRISISLSGAVDYASDNQSVNANIECTVQKLQAKNDWLIGFLER